MRELQRSSKANTKRYRCLVVTNLVYRVNACIQFKAVEPQLRDQVRSHANQGCPNREHEGFDSLLTTNGRQEEQPRHHTSRHNDRPVHSVHYTRKCSRQTIRRYHQSSTQGQQDASDWLMSELWGGGAGEACTHCTVTTSM